MANNARVVRVAELPNGENVVFRDSSFFKNNNAGGNLLPSPEKVRQKGGAARGDRPPPVRFEERGLVVKYGSCITVAEAQCLWYFNRHMKDKVPTPELFGWCRDGGETFIYMQLIRGDTLEEAWPSLSEEERRTICEQLRGCVKAWRELRQESEPYYIGHIGRQGVGDIIFSDHMEPNPGPFAGLGAFHDFFARYASRRRDDPGWNPRRDPGFPELAGLTDDRPVVFTHADLCRRNIMVSPRDDGGEDSGSAPRPRRVVAILDWHQSGWYPIDWEWLKAQWMCEPLADGSGGRDTAWLSQILAPADENYSYAWEYITSCW